MVLGFCFWIILFRFDVIFCINSSIFFSSTTTPSSFLVKVSDLDSSSTSKKNLFQSQLFNDLTSTTDFPRPPINNVLFTKNLTDAYVVVPTPTTITPHDKSDVSMDLPSLEFQNYTSVFQYNYKNSSSIFDDRGMWILYEITNWFLAKIQPNEFPDYLLTDDDLIQAQSFITSFKQNYRQWLKYEQGFLIVAAVCLICVALFTICYLIYFCFCRTCCCCWSSCKNVDDDEDEEKMDKKLDSCKRHCYNAVLALTILVMAFSMVCASISNEYVHKAMSNLANNLRRNVDDISLYKEDTNLQLKSLLVNDYGTLYKSIENTLNVASNVIIHRTKEISGAVSLDHLADLTRKASQFETNLNSIENSTNKLQFESLKLRNDLTKLKEWFTDELRNCLNGIDEGQKSECRSALTLMNNYKNLPDAFVSSINFDELKRELKKVISYNVSSKLNDAQRQFDNLKLQLNEKILSDRKVVVDRMNEIGAKLESTWKNISKQIERIDVSQSKTYIDSYESDVEYYEFYRYIGGFILCGFICLTIIFLSLGLLFGICGRRPGYYDDDCCVWSRGGCLFCWGIFFGVLFLITFMCIAIGLFIVGGNSRTIICQNFDDDSIQNVRSSAVYNMIQRYVDVFKDHSDARRNRAAYDFLREFNISSVVNGCIDNKTFYNVFDLEKRFDLKNLKTSSKNDAYRELNFYLQRIENFRFDANFESLLNSETENLLNNLQNANLSSHLTTNFVENIRNGSSSYNFEKNIELLRRTITETNHVELSGVLKQLVFQLETMERENGAVIRDLFSTMADNLTDLAEQISSLTKEIPDLIKSAKNAENLLSTNLTGYIQTIARQIVDRIKLSIDEYLNRIENQLNNEITSCKPIKRIASSLVVHVCDSTLNPFNGFWFSVGVCLLLSIPSMILSSWLKDLYGSTAPYVSEQGHSTTARSRNGRVNTFITATDNYEYYSRLGDPSSKPASRSKKSAGWRTPSNSIYYSDINSFPPPPYHQSPSGRR